MSDGEKPGHKRLCGLYDFERRKESDDATG
jgi:hypothetical protein